MKLLNNGKKFWTSPDISIYGVLAEESFLAEVQKERLRAIRTQRPLTLVLFGVEQDNDTQGQNEYTNEFLASTIVDCTRACEPKGWYRCNGSSMVGILLPETPLTQSQIVINRVKDLFESSWQRNKSEKDGTAKLVYDIKELIPSGQGRQTEDFGQHHMDKREKPNQDCPSSSDSVKIGKATPFWKRTIDLIGSFFGIVVTLPVTIPLGLFIKMVSPGPIFYHQIRIGFEGRKFTMYKFRTMKVNADTSKHREYVARLILAEKTEGTSAQEKAMIKLEDDPQIIWGGKWIRALSLDELPQLINVLKGEMSLIGPRPPIPYEAAEYEPWHKQRFDVVPGMTGLWQVSGKNNLSFSEMVRLDIRYGNSLSLTQESKILARTLPTIVGQFKACFRKRYSSVEAANEKC